jgi:hypothetical protein
MLDQIKKMLPGILGSSKQPWWVEVTTTQPDCTYYFGPFDNSDEATTARPGYVEDLKREGVAKIEAVVKQCKPEALTISKE